MTSPIPGRYDVIWFSNVLHIYSPKDNEGMFRRIRDALNPRGRLIIQDAFLDRNGTRPLETNLFAVTMLLFTEAGNTYPFVETMQWLRRAGFSQIKTVRLKRGTGDWDNGLLEARLARGNSRRVSNQR
jgi:hypothetical protein